MKLFSNHLVLTSALVAFSVSACGDKEAIKTTLASSDALESKLATACQGELPSQADFEAIIAALPSSTEMTVGDYQKDGEGVVAKDVRLAFGDEGARGVTLGSLRVCDMDRAAVTGLLAGKIEGEGTAIGRLDARDMEVFGIAEFSNSINDKTIAAMADAMVDETNEEAREVFTDAAATEVTEATYTVASMMMDPLVLHPADFKAIDLDSPWGLVELYAVASRAFSVDNYVLGDTVQITEQSVEGATTTSSTKVDYTAITDYNRGDLATMISKGMIAEFDTEADSEMPAFSFTYSLNSLKAENIQVSELLEALIDQSVPADDNTDFLSAGLWAIEGLELSMGDLPLFAMPSFTLDMTEFHHLLPTKITGRTTSTYYVNNFFEFAKSLAPEETGTENAAAMEELAQFQAVLTEQGLNELAYNSKTDYSWAPNDGTTALSLDQDYEDFLRIKIDVAGSQPAYETFTAIEGVLDEIGPAVSEAYRASSALANMSIAITDNGGVNSILAVMIAAAEAEEPGGAGQLAMLRGQKPEEFRVAMGTMVVMGGQQFAAQIPAAAGYASALGGFLTEGGTLTIAANPETAVSAATFGELTMLATNPPALLEKLDLQNTHEAPAE